MAVHTFGVLDIKEEKRPNCSVAEAGAKTRAGTEIGGKKAQFVFQNNTNQLVDQHTGLSLVSLTITIAETN